MIHLTNFIHFRDAVEFCVDSIYISGLCRQLQWKAFLKGENAEDVLT